jgi:hypothetical protein
MKRMNGWRGVAQAALLSTALLTACGGGDGVGSPLPPLPGIACSTPDQRLWLDSYFDAWYFWYRLAPDPNPLREMTVAEFFEASLYTGNDARFPRDRWSYLEPSADFDRFFGDGKLLGYGVFLAGIETDRDPARPLLVRYVEPQSDAAARGVKRGDQVVSVNGRPAAEIVASDDYGVFTPSSEGQTLALVLRSGGTERSVTLRASAFTLTPVTLGRVLQTPQGRRMGYLHVKDMIDPAAPALAGTFADFRTAGVNELVIDLRYNGGGLVSLSRTLASYVNGARTRDQVYASLLFNDRRARDENETFRFAPPPAALNLTRVYVLTGPRTCSASELVINGLRPFVDVVAIGDTTCGKPVGFRPVSRCDTTFNVVNFESVNARNEGRYFDGIAPTCAVAEDFSRPLGVPDEPLLAAAIRHADSGSCPVGAGGVALQRPMAAGAPRLRGGEPPERQGMWRR